MTEDQNWARVSVFTNGVWRARQVASALDALDGLIVRVATAAMLADICQSNYHVISNLRVLGLLKQGDPSKWDRATGSMTDVARTDYVEFVHLMRRFGVEVRQTPVTLEFSFLVPDILQVVPDSSRLEVVELLMASPGKWLLTMSGTLAKETLLRPLQGLFDALFFPQETRSIKRAQARGIRATARKTEAEAERIRVETGLIQARALSGVAGVFEANEASLRNAGFRPGDADAAVFERARQALNVLTTLRAGGFLDFISLGLPEKSERDPDTSAGSDP